MLSLRLGCIRLWWKVRRFLRSWCGFDKIVVYSESDQTIMRCFECGRVIMQSYHGDVIADLWRGARDHECV